MSSDRGLRISRRGTLFVVSAPSGAGKTTLCREARLRVPDLAYSVSCTTRAPRPGEVDGSDFRFVSREAFGAMRERGERLDLVYVSHIDEDHISGVLRLLDDADDWCVHDFQLTRGNAVHKPPRSMRPPEIGAIWHNAFHELVGDNAGPIESMLAATAI